jgi:hypothetical protein
VPPSSIHMAGRDPLAKHSVELASWTRYTLREVLRRGMGRIKRERLVTQAVRDAHQNEKIKMYPSRSQV